MLSKILSLVLVLSFNSYCLCQTLPSWTKLKTNETATIRDSSGRIVGSVNTTNNNSVFRDSGGRIVGTQSPNGTLRDNSGRYAGSITPSTTFKRK